MQFILLNITLFLIALAAGLLPLTWGKLQEKMHLAIAFASGVLLGAVALHMFPGSYEILGNIALLVTAISFSIFFIPHKLISANPNEKASFKRLGYLAFFGITLHSLTDGIGVGAIGPGDSFLHVVFAVGVHKFPATIALSLLMLASGFGRRQTAWMIFLFALTTPAGAFLTRTLLTGQNHAIQGYALALSAGNFLAVIFGDLSEKSPETRTARAAKIMFFVLGFFANALHLH